ncbi:type II toxin-antitoxin system death-on-curing family toxin [Thiolapillus sp.]|uniref:type II toxin-antitoxin system death-on-curing family toxin n=2 Tax=Thiolapillus sp. TaxID=2017437 RepID=UPI0025F0A0A1|nr:Fic family protein [Thiolapillus sp.]
MTTPVIYLTLEQAIDIHHKTVEVSGGGAMGYLELGKLESVLTHIQNDDYYPTFADKLTHLFFGACKFHSFEDGNKRIAITLCAQMLLLNGYLYCSGNFIREMENISYHVAAGLIDKNLLGEIITAVLDDEFESESLKLKILNAISVDNGEG